MGRQSGKNSWVKVWLVSFNSRLQKWSQKKCCMYYKPSWWLSGHQTHQTSIKSWGKPFGGSPFSLTPNFFSSLLPYCTCVCVMVPVQCGELFAVVPGERVPSVAVVTTHSQLVEVGLVLHSKTGVLSKHLPPGPVLQCDQQFIVPLVRQPVDVLQTQPVLAVDVAKALLWSDRDRSVGDVSFRALLEGFWHLARMSREWLRSARNDLRLFMTWAVDCGSLLSRTLIVNRPLSLWLTLAVKFFTTILLSDQSKTDYITKSNWLDSVFTLPWNHWNTQKQQMGNKLKPSSLLLGSFRWSPCTSPSSWRSWRIHPPSSGSQSSHRGRASGRTTPAWVCWRSLASPGTYRWSCGPLPEPADSPWTDLDRWYKDVRNLQSSISNGHIIEIKRRTLRKGRMTGIYNRESHPFIFLFRFPF